MKTTQEAIEIRNSILLSFEEAAVNGIDKQNGLNNIVIVERQGERHGTARQDSACTYIVFFFDFQRIVILAK